MAIGRATFHLAVRGRERTIGNPTILDQSGWSVRFLHSFCSWLAVRGIGPRWTPARANSEPAATTQPVGVTA